MVCGNRRPTILGERIHLLGNAARFLRALIIICIPQYELLNPLDALTPFARLRVSREGGASAGIALELSVDIWLHSVMCDGIVAALLLMCKTNDPWLECAGIRLP